MLNKLLLEVILYNIIVHLKKKSQEKMQVSLDEIKRQKKKSKEISREDNFSTN